MRKIIQIATIPSTQQYEQALVALCDDNTLWMHSSNDGKWHTLPDIPQDEANHEPNL